MKALLITPEDVKKKTALNGNVDVNLFIQFVEIAQDIHVQNYLGTKLLERYQLFIIEENLNDFPTYKNLLNDYIKPMLIHWAMFEYIPFASYSFNNKGVSKPSSENSETVSDKSLNTLIDKQRNLAEYYTTRFVDYICANSTLFPEYKTNVTGNVYPDTDSTFSGWAI
jgi:hypothetical protein